MCCDHVGSLQLQQIRQAVRSHSSVVFGKNTLIKKAIRALLPEMPHLEKLLPCFKWNVGFVFTNGDLKTCRDELVKNQVPAVAKPGQNAQSDVVIPAQNTGLDPGQTAFFQALAIPTRINKGCIEIMNDVKLITAGEKVGQSECALLQKLNIKPFHFGLEIRYCFNDGAVFEPSILDLDSKCILQMVKNVVSDLACIGLATGIPNKASIPHVIANAAKDIMAVALETDYDLPLVAQVKEMLKNPGAYASSAPAAATSAAPVAAAAAPVVVEKKEEEMEDFGFSLFD